MVRLEEKDLAIDMAGNRKVFISENNSDTSIEILKDRLYEIDGIIEEIKETIFMQGNDEMINFYKNELLEANIERDNIINEINKL